MVLYAFATKYHVTDISVKLTRQPAWYVACLPTRGPAVSVTTEYCRMRLLRWLPVVYRIRNKLRRMVDAVHNDTIPSGVLLPEYQRFLVAVVSDLPRQASLTYFASGSTAERAFSAAGAQELGINILPAAIRNTAEVSAFKCTIKPHFFNLAYSDI